MIDFESKRRRPISVDFPSSTLPHVLKRRISIGAGVVAALRTGAGDGTEEVEDGEATADMKVQVCS
jgi:hypothetical protein